MSRLLTDEERSVQDWRWDELTDRGVEAAVAHVLAGTDADLHVMCDAKVAGCSDALLLRIFANGETVPDFQPVRDLVHA